jgi:flavodoxin
MYGNTHSIAQAIAEGLGTAGAGHVVSVEEAARMNLSGINLLVVGGPTHAHGMTRTQTRHAAVQDAMSRD